MNSELQRQHIKSQLNDNIKKYEQQRNLEKEQQQRQKLLIKKNIFEQLINKQRSSAKGSSVGQPSEPQSGGSANRNKNDFSYSFGNKEAGEEVSREQKRSHNSSNEESNESQRDDIPTATQLPPSFMKSPSGLAAAATFGTGRNFVENQEELNNSSQHQSEASYEEGPSEQSDTLNQFGQSSRKKNSYESAKDQPFERNLTESSKYGSYFTNNRRGQQLSQPQVKNFPLESSLYKEPEVKSPAKKQNILNLFPSQQFGPKPKSPIRKLPQKHISPPKVPGSIYNVTGQVNLKEVDSPLREYTKKADRPPIIDRLNESNGSLRDTPNPSILSQKTTQSREQQSTAKKQLLASNSSKSIPSLIPLETFGKSPSPKLPSITVNKPKDDMPPLKRIPDGLIPLSQLESEEQKPYGTYIGNQQDQDHIEQLRKKKLQQLEKKRQKRTEDRKKSADEKPSKEPPEGTHHATQQGFHQAPPPLNKYTAIHNKRGKNQDDNSDIKSNQTVHSYKSLSKPMETRVDPEVRRVIKPELHKQKQEQLENRSHNSTNFIDNSQTILRDPSPSHTPKTITTNKTAKTLNSRSIFDETSPGKSREKSINKFSHEPKIQPKERKQTFTKQSNKKLMINAITNVCLPGEINRKQREKLVEIINSDPGEFFIFLFKEYSRKLIKGIYTYESGSNRLRKVYGEKTPVEIFEENVTEFYRYDSGAREFKILDGCKSFSYVVHGVFIK